MNRYDLECGYGGGDCLVESVDGEWIRYEDHVEAMKRIAGAEQRYTQADMERFGKAVADAREARIAGDSAQQAGQVGLIERLKGHSEDKRNTAFSRSSMREAIEYLSAAPATASQQAEPVAWLFDNEEDGKHWYDTPQPMGRPVYAAPAPSDSGPLINKGTKPVTAEDVRANRRNGESMWDTKARLEGAPSASPICTCPSGDGSLRHPCPSHPSASPAALTDEQALDISIDLGMVRKDYGGYFVNKLTVEEIMEAIRSLCAESPAAPIAAETEPMAWLFVKSGKKMKIFVRAEASELLDGHYPLFGQSASQLKRHVPQANEQFIAPKLELLAASPAAPAPASPAALTDAQIQEVLQKLAPAWWDVPQGATEAFARALLAASHAKGGA